MPDFKDTVSAWVRENLFETLKTDTEAFDAVRVVETILCIADDQKNYFDNFCSACEVKNDDAGLLEWQKALATVYREQMCWLEDNVFELKRAGNHLF